jgi:hypothetical protein
MAEVAVSLLKDGYTHHSKGKSLVKSIQLWRIFMQGVGHKPATRSNESGKVRRCQKS